jgi:hypothetical protein
MRLVEDHRRVIRQHLPVLAAAQREVGEEEMMIDDHYVGVLCPLPHPRDKAGVVVRALLSEANLGTRVDVSPERQVFRQPD